MLILSRAAGERIVITTSDGRITITFCKIRNGRARIGIEAPDDVLVNREEVQDALDAQTGE